MDQSWMNTWIPKDGDYPAITGGKFRVETSSNLVQVCIPGGHFLMKLTAEPLSEGHFDAVGFDEMKEVKEVAGGVS